MDLIRNWTGEGRIRALRVPQQNQNSHQKLLISAGSNQINSDILTFKLIYNVDSRYNSFTKVNNKIYKKLSDLIF